MQEQTIGETLKLIGLLLKNKSSEHNGETNDDCEVAFEIGEKYFIRTVTYHLVGQVEKIKGNFIIFKKGTMSWIADTERFMDAINDGKLKEVEPVSVSGGVNINSITDFFVWEHPLPRTQM